MAGIQASINQGISIAGFLFSQTEFAKTQQKIAGLKSKAKTYDKRMDLLSKEYQKQEFDEKLYGESLQNKIKLQGEKYDILEEIYKMDPTAETYKAKQDLLAEKEINEGSLDTLNKKREKGAEQEAEDYARTQAMMEYDEQQRMNAEHPIENWETQTPDPTETARQKADESLAVAQEQKIETNNRKKGFTSQRYGTNKTKITFGGNN